LKQQRDGNLRTLLTRDQEDDLAHLNPSAAEVFYNDLPAPERAKWFSKTSTHAVGTKRAGATGMSWKEIPSWYLVCEEDGAIPVFAQEAMTGMVKQMGGEIMTERIKSGHSPFLSWPDYTVDWIRRAAGEEV